ncbi:cupin domain-containing protein [Thiothrix litoralis]|jgi:quercetin dioxygenase-like cupin family protein|uniref:Cupin domain-containing protein n=1 Tax=Thiothrix litoralis TaxID=2891210 RepID=A0ABX7WPP6_9GAMM|nr:cupin domain-containing protein [Thiothrix litoralis]QTR45535.1 cupin domain-containing protein [Thiothrix litoralis]
MKLTTLTQTPITTVSHNARIQKQALITYGEFPPLTNFSQATFPPGEIAHAHQHSDMLEVFFIQSGHAAMTVDGIEYDLPAGSCISIEPGETHELRNASATEAMLVTYFGVQVH